MSFTRSINFLFPAVAAVLSVLAAPCAYSQCCSTGSPVGASVNVGILNAHVLRVSTYFRHSYSDTYFEKDHRVSENVQLSHSGFNYLGALVGYGLTRRLTLEADAGYYFDKTQKFKQIDLTVRGRGLSNGAVTVKYGAFVKPALQMELTTGAGIRFPFSTTPKSVDGVQLNRDVQPSTNALGATGLLFFSKGFPGISMRVFTINRFEYNFRDRSDYRYGSILFNSLFASKKILPDFYGIAQVRSEWKQHDRDFANPDPEAGSEVVNSGYLLLTFSPQLSYSIAGKWNLSAVFDLPVYKRYNGRQMTPGWSFALSLTRDINL